MGQAPRVRKVAHQALTTLPGQLQGSLKNPESHGSDKLKAITISGRHQLVWGRELIFSFLQLEEFPFGSCESEASKSLQRFSFHEIGEICDFSICTFLYSCGFC
jgi:hypothetical protein